MTSKFSNQHALSRVPMETQMKNESNSADEDAGQSHPYWYIPSQHEIVILGATDGSIEIQQKIPLKEDQSVSVVASNVVLFARSVLNAAGFDDVLLAVGNGGSFADLYDGDTPKSFGE